MCSSSTASRKACSFLLPITALMRARAICGSRMTIFRLEYRFSSSAISPRVLSSKVSWRCVQETLADASARDVAVGLFGAKRVARDWYADGGLRSRVRRLVRRGFALMRGDYRRLAQLD